MPLWTERDSCGSDGAHDLEGLDSHGDRAPGRERLRDVRRPDRKRRRERPPGHERGRAPASSRTREPKDARVARNRAARAADAPPLPPSRCACRNARTSTRSRACCARSTRVRSQAICRARCYARCSESLAGRPIGTFRSRWSDSRRARCRDPYCPANVVGWIGDPLPYILVCSETGTYLPGERARADTRASILALIRR